eukprot:m.644462 g.644462  ORF g.644462 m.644462 type:complete len:172 (+) comp22649_c0_seq5:104-619(+)
MSAVGGDEKLGAFFAEVKTIEKRDEVWTAEKQISRLTKPGSSYRNINPYEVLLIDRDATEQEIKKQTRKLQFLVHPDKNRDNAEMAKQAFEEIGEAKKKLADEEKMAYVNKVLDEADQKTQFELDQKRAEGRKKGIKDFPEDTKEGVLNGMRPQVMPPPYFFYVSPICSLL